MSIMILCVFLFQIITNTITTIQKIDETSTIEHDSNNASENSQTKEQLVLKYFRTEENLYEVYKSTHETQGKFVFLQNLPTKIFKNNSFKVEDYLNRKYKNNIILNGNENFGEKTFSSQRMFKKSHESNRALKRTGLNQENYLLNHGQQILPNTPSKVSRVSKVNAVTGFEFKNLPIKHFRVLLQKISQHKLIKKTPESIQINSFKPEIFFHEYKNTIIVFFLEIVNIEEKNELKKFDLRKIFYKIRVEYKILFIFFPEIFFIIIRLLDECSFDIFFSNLKTKDEELKEKTFLEVTENMKRLLNDFTDDYISFCDQLTIISANKNYDLVKNDILCIKKKIPIKMIIIIQKFIYELASDFIHKNNLRSYKNFLDHLEFLDVPNKVPLLSDNVLYQYAFFMCFLLDHQETLKLDISIFRRRNKSNNTGNIYNIAIGKFLLMNFIKESKIFFDRCKYFLCLDPTLTQFLYFDNERYDITRSGNMLNFISRNIVKRITFIELVKIFYNLIHQIVFEET